MNFRIVRSIALAAACIAVVKAGFAKDDEQASRFLAYRPPAGALPATRHVTIDGLDAAVINNGRLLTPAGVEVSVGAPKPFGLAVAPNGHSLLTVNSGTTPFSITLVTDLGSSAPKTKLVNLHATFMGAVFSPDGQRFYISGGDNGNIWVGETGNGNIVGSINLNGAAHPLTRPLDPVAFGVRFKGTFPGRMTISSDGRWLYVVDQGAFQVHVIDTTKVAVGVEAGKVKEPDNFAAVVARIAAGRYPFDVSLSTDGRRLYVANVGTFQYRHLMPPNPTGNKDLDYPLCIPGAGYPDETVSDRTITISPVDPRHLPDALRDPAGIRCGYVKQTQDYTVPGLGSPNAPESNSVWTFDVTNPLAAVRTRVTKTGPSIAEKLSQSLDDDDDDEERAYAGAHPNTVVASREYLYVANGNDDSISIVGLSGEVVGKIKLSPLTGADARLKGVQPVALALSPDQQILYVAEAGLNAIGVVRLDGKSGRVLGHVPTGWWPASVAVSNDGRTLYVANARGRGAGPNNITAPDNLGSPKSATIGSVSIIPVPNSQQLGSYTTRVLKNNGFVSGISAAELSQMRRKVAWVQSQVKHVIFINKENATYDLLLGDITKTASGQAVNGQPAYSLGAAASPNHHALALKYAFSDNFYLEPSVSSDGHRWLTNTYTSEFEETHWPASYGGRRRDAGDDPASYLLYPGRLGFTDANSSPEPNDLNERGSIYLHLARNRKSFVNFGNGFEFAEVDEDSGTEPTGIRNHVNVPMEKVVRDNTDHLYPEYNTGIPDAPLPEDPGRFNRFGRFSQVFQSQYVNDGKCALPSYVDLYYPNDHGGGANDIYPDGSQPWSYTRFVQDNDDALGRTVELISKSPCWKDTVIFVAEDDGQNGFDHVDGYRSIFLAIGPSVKPGYLVTKHISLESIFKTVDLILGLPPLNLYDAAAADLLELWADPQSAPRDKLSATTSDAYRRPEMKYDTSNAIAWERATKNIDFGARDSKELILRDAIRRSEGLPRKKPEGRFED